MKAFLPLALFAALCAFMAYGMFRENKNEVFYTMEGKQFPTLIADGQEVNLLFGDEPVVINFFASWCMPCNVEHGALVSLSKKNIAPIIGIAWKNKKEDADKWLSERGSPYTYLIIDAAGDSTVPLGLTGVPETFVIDKHGKVAYHSKQPLSKMEVTNKIIPLIERLKEE